MMRAKMRGTQPHVEHTSANSSLVFVSEGVGVYWERGNGIVNKLC
jgi:hypothetical protein